MSGIERRKQRHIRLVLEKETQTDLTTGFEDVKLVHRCLPEMDLSEVSTVSELFGKRLSAPLIISAMTGGTDEARGINEALAAVAEEFSIGIGVGSQRIAIENPSTECTFKIVRDRAPSTLVMANIGCPQLSLGWGPQEARRAVDMIDADALAIHMNPLQEAIQVEGETRYKGILSKVKEIVDSVNVPIVMKETGSGVAYEDATKILQTGAKGIDVSGVGGTSWAAVEHHIAKEEGKAEQEALGESLWNWGIPTAVSVVETSSIAQLKIIASGGVRSGVDMAKAIALGADAVGVAKPFLAKAVEGDKALRAAVAAILLEFQTVMFLVGARNIEELKHVTAVITGRTAEWLRLRGFNPERFSTKRER